MLLEQLQHFSNDDCSGAIPQQFLLLVPTQPIQILQRLLVAELLIQVVVFMLVAMYGFQLLFLLQVRLI